MILKIDKKKEYEMAYVEPVETFIGFALKRIGIEQYEKWKKEDKDIAILKLRTVAWYYKLRASGCDHEDAKIFSKCMMVQELIIRLSTHVCGEKKGE